MLSPKELAKAILISYIQDRQQTRSREVHNHFNDWCCSAFHVLKELLD